MRAIISGVPRELAESQGFPWDMELWPMVATSTGGVLAAARAARETGSAGSLSSGLHHARAARGAGFCTVNGLVLAAKAARTTGARVVLIVDLDAHCGGGTAALIANDPHIWQLDIATDRFDAYRPAPTTTLDIVRDAATYLPILKYRLAALDAQADQIDLCLYNAGMDPDSRCDIGGLEGITPTLLAERERLVFGWCWARHVPIAFVLAGGYIGQHLKVPELVALHRLTLEAAVRDELLPM